MQYPNFAGLRLAFPALFLTIANAFLVGCAEEPEYYLGSASLPHGVVFTYPMEISGGSWNSFMRIQWN